METNTVALSLKDYNRLRDFYKAVKRNDVIKVRQCYSSDDIATYFSKDEAVIEIGEINKKLSEGTSHAMQLHKSISRRYDNVQSENNNLKREVTRLKDKLGDSPINPWEERHKSATQRLRKMSVLQFIKWRRK